MMDGISVVIPAGGRARLHLLDATLASIRACAGVDQIILAEFGPAADSLDLARKWGADHVLVRSSAAYERATALNAGTQLARREIVLWTDGDFLFDPGFMTSSRDEMLATGADYFYGHSHIHYLAEDDSEQVRHGQRHLATCRPMRVLEALAGNPGGLGFVRASFARSNGGMVEGFKGWGSEDHAWLHKARVLGRVEVTRACRLVWHQFHGDSGSHSVDAWRRASRLNPHTQHNWALFDTIQAASDAETFLQCFPPPVHVAPPWPRETRFAFLVAPARSQMRAMAEEWAGRLQRIYGVEVSLVPAGLAGVARALEDIGAATIVAFAQDRVSAYTLAAAIGPRPALMVLGSGVDAVDRPGDNLLLMAAEQGSLGALAAGGRQVWHRPWSEDEAPGTPAPPPVVGPLSQIIGCQRDWGVRIVLDRANFEAAAFDRPRFWYVGLHDADHVEVARDDARGAEIVRAAAAGDTIVIERRFQSTSAPKSWTVWPTDRQGRWLGKLSGPVDAGCLM